jgi:hypothetical protein
VSSSDFDVECLTTGGGTLTSAQAEHVSPVLAGHARDAAELRDWLETVGLLPAPSGKRHRKGPPP